MNAQGRQERDRVRTEGADRAGRAIARGLVCLLRPVPPVEASEATAEYRLHQGIYEALIFLRASLKDAIADAVEDMEARRGR